MGVSGDQLRAAASAATFSNGWDNSANYATAIWANSPAFVANANKFMSMTVGQYFAANPGTVAVAQAIGNNIYVDATWVNSLSGVDTAALVMHELIHNITGNVDSVLQQQLNSVLPEGQQIAVGSASKSIADALARDCWQ
jgi:hypothetical protein